MKIFTQLLLFAVIFAGFEARAQYCMLPGRTIYSQNQPGITNFKLGTINRTSDNVEKPMNQPSLVVTTDSVVLQRGKTYQVSITHTRDSLFFPSARNNIRVWVDYNSDKDFIDAGETVISKDYEYYGTYTDSFTVPATTKLGITRLRATAKMSSDAGHSIPTPCDDPADPIDYHGEMEDYTVTIIAATNVETVETGRNMFTVHPNPTTGTVSLAFSGLSAQELNISLYDMTGKRVVDLLHTPQQLQQEYSFDLNNYNIPQGIYILQVNSGASVSYQRIAKVN